MGYETYLEKHNCRCGAKPGELHLTMGCDDEQCPICGLTFSTVTCEHAAAVLEGAKAERLPWTGVPPMVEEAAELGFFVRWDGPSDWPSQPGCWVPCGKGHPDAKPSRNSVVDKCRWDAAARKFVLR